MARIKQLHEESGHLILTFFDLSSGDDLSTAMLTAILKNSRRAVEERRRMKKEIDDKRVNRQLEAFTRRTDQHLSASRSARSFPGCNPTPTQPLAHRYLHASRTRPYPCRLLP